MLQKLDELLRQYELSENYYEKARLLREIQYLNMVVRRSIKQFIDKLTRVELIKIARRHNIDGDVETIKTALYTRLNCHTNIFADFYSINKRILVTKNIIALAKEHDVQITNDQEFIKVLSDFINTINNYDLRELREYARYEALDFATRTLYASEINSDTKVDPIVLKKAKEELSRRTVEASYASEEALLRFFRPKLSKFNFELLALLLKLNALEPEISKDKGNFIFRVKDFNFYDSYLTVMKEVPITMDDIDYGLELGSVYSNGIKRQGN